MSHLAFRGSEKVFLFPGSSVDEGPAGCLGASDSRSEMRDAKCEMLSVYFRRTFWVLGAGGDLVISS
jgi:hypothetical protein